MRHSTVFAGKPEQINAVTLICSRFAPKITGKPLDKKIRIGAVSYLNTKPLLYGLANSSPDQDIELTLDYPAAIAEGLLNDKLDIGLVPVAIIPKLTEYHLVSDYCIGCDGQVASVCIFSDVPLEEAETVLLDYQSRTSVALTRILLKHYWKLNPVLQDTGGDEFIHRIGQKKAGLVIGDRALEQRRHSRYIYDLGEAWKAYTGLGFVFATWISNKKIDAAFLEAFNKLNGIGFKHLTEIINANPFPHFDLEQYYTRFVSYNLDENKKAGMNLFLQMIMQ
jgi:chorismate dehydratase